MIFVRVGVGGSDDSSRIGVASDSHSQDVSQDVGGMVARCSHMNMLKLLVEDRRSMFYGESPKLIDMNIERARQRTTQPESVKKVSFNSSVVCVGNGA